MGKTHGKDDKSIHDAQPRMGLKNCKKYSIRWADLIMAFYDPYETLNPLLNPIADQLHHFFFVGVID